MEKNTWISAVLISSVTPCLLLPTMEKITYLTWEKEEIKNDFCLIHNPNADYPLIGDILGCATVLHKDGSLVGKQIFPVFE